MINATRSSGAAPYYFQNPLAGMRRAVEQANSAAQRIAEGDVSPENMVSTMEAKIMMKANAVTLKAADSMLGTLLDEKA